jgi:hypothetical protein
VLYFDLNNTILLRDPAAGYSSVKHNLATNITKQVWGRVSNLTLQLPEDEDKENSNPNLNDQSMQNLVQPNF